MKRPLRHLLLVMLFILLAPVLALAWLVSTENGLHWAYQQAKGYVPGELSIASLSGTISGPITLNDIRFQQRGLLIEAEQLIVDWRPGTLLSGGIDINQLQARSLTISLPAAEQTKPSDALTLPDIHLPWRLALKGVLVDDLAIIENEQVYTIDQIVLDADALFSRIDIERLAVQGDAYTINLTGTLNPVRNYRHDLTMRWRYSLPTEETMEGSGQIKGDVNLSLIKQRVDGPLTLSLNGQITDLIKHLRWQTKLKANSGNIALIDAALPAAKLSTTIQAEGDLSSARLFTSLSGDHADSGPFDATIKLKTLEQGTIEIELLQLHASKHGTRLDVQGQWQPGTGGGRVDLALHWQDLRWPLNATPWFDSALGSGWVKGTLDQYQFGLATDRPWSEAPPSDWFASATGDLNGMTFHSLRIDALEGETDVRGHLGWTPELAWQATLNLTDINPATLHKAWPGRLNGTAVSQGGYQDDRLSVNADIQALTGTLRNYPLALQSRLTWRDDTIDFKQFELRSADSLLNLQGHVGASMQLAWSVDSQDLAQLYPDAAGQLIAQGRLDGPRENPRIQATLNGNSLRLSGYGEIGTIDADIDLDLMDHRQLDVRLSAQALQVNDVVVQSLDLMTDSQNLQAQVDMYDVNLLFALSGQGDERGWQGHVEQAEIHSQALGIWQLKSPAPLSLSEKFLKLDSLCWHKQDAQLCADLSFLDQRWRTGLALTQLPLSLFSPWLPADLELEGVSDGAATFTYTMPDQLFGEAKIRFPQGAVSYPLLEVERNRWQYRGGTLDLKLDEEAIVAHAELAAGNGDRLDARLSLPGASLLALDPLAQAMDTEARVKIHDLSLVEALLDEVQDLRGEIDIQLKADGSLGQPNIRGHADLRDGSLRVPRLGLNVHQLSASGKSDDREHLTFRLDARSGEGTLKVQGQTALNSVTGWPTTVAVEGEGFEVSRIPEARMEVSPDLKIDIRNRTIRTEGQVHIPYAKLQPKDITSAARVSEDTVIIGGEQAAVEKWRIFNRIRLTLGERVDFFGFGFEGRLKGNILLEDESGQLTRATGEVNVPEGRYRAYGQRLDVEQGRLLYTGGPLDNPGLDFRSVRRVGNVTAGLKVRGTLNQPRIELFSVPAMGETDALSYLLLGRPIENASGEEGAMMAKATLALGIIGGDRLARSLGDRFGLDEMRVETSETDDQASLVIGRYLSPKLYISHGVGLIEAVNTLNIRYEISDQWQLKGESGEHQSADLLYTIER